MRNSGLPPSVSDPVARGVGNLAGLLLTAYGKLFSNPEVYRHEVGLEPPFFHFHFPMPFTLQTVIAEVIETMKYSKESARRSVDYDVIRFWFSESDKSMDFRAAWQEMGFLIGSPLMFLCFGNASRIQVLVRVPALYTKAVSSMLTSKMPHLQCEVDSKGVILAGLRDYLHKLPSDLDYDLLDMVTPPPFFRSLRAPGKNIVSPFGIVFSSLRNISPPGIGILRLLFIPTIEKWGGLLSQIVQYESSRLPLGYVPKDELQAAMEKSASGPFFAVSLWIAALAEKDSLQPILHSLSVPFLSLKYGGESLAFLTGRDYRKIFSSREGFVNALLSFQPHRAGSLLTPAELALCFEFPRQELIQDEDYPLQKALAVRRPKKIAEPGLKLGYTTYAGMEEPVFQPAKIRRIHTVVVGKTGKGKSIAMGEWALEMAEAGMGFGVIDPHGWLVPWLLERLPKKRWQDVILFDPTDRDWVLKFNITELEPGQDVGKVADDRTSAVRAQYSRSFWGDNIQLHLSNHFETALSIPGMNLSEMKALGERGNYGRALREKALAHVENPELLRYWEEVFPNTSRDQLARVAAKITPFLQKELVGRVFYERENAFRFREIIDSKKIFLANIPSGLLGGTSCNLICSTLASCFYHAALSRQDIREENRTEFCLLMDEYQRITTRDSEDALRECRKHRLALYVAFQQRGQMPDTIRTALANCGTLCAFDVGLEDAQTIFKEFYGEVPMKNLMRKGERKAFCMIDGDIVNLHTYPAPKPLKRNYEREIRENCRQLYYVPRYQAEYYKAVRRSRAERRKRRRRKPPVCGQYDEISE